MDKKKNIKQVHSIILLVIFLNILSNCTYSKENSKIEGIWEGTLQYPGFESRIVFIITLKLEGTFQAKMVMPDQGDTEFCADEVKINNSKLNMDFKQIKGSFSCEYKAKKGNIVGQWTQAQRSIPLILNRISEISKPARPQTPEQPYPYDEHEITFTNNKGDVKITGTLTIPKTKSSYPVVILIPGVGAHDRDYTVFGHRPFLVIADYLTRNGIAVLRYDERGVGASTGDRSRATTEDYTLDVLAGVEFLKSLLEINSEQIGLIGHSEGGTIAALAAVKSADISFIIMMGSPGLSGEEYNYQFEESMGKALGLIDEDIIRKLNFQKKVINILLHEEDLNIAKRRLFEIYDELDPNIPADKKELAIKRFISPWFIFNIKHDPGATLKKVKCPVLAIFGEKDLQVPPERNLVTIKHSLTIGGNKDFEVKELPGLNHFFQTAETGAPNEYGRIEETISSTVLELISRWIYNHVILKKNK